MVAIISPKLLINGELVDASDKKTFALYNPATREKVADVPEASAQDTNAAVAAAKAAFPAWSALNPTVRAGYLKKLAVLLRTHTPELARLEAVSMGRPIDQFFDSYAAASHYDHYAEAWPQIQGQASLHTPGYVTMTLRQPVGVVAAIIPWNVPLLFFASKSAPALISGNTVVVKTSEKAPLAAARVAELVQEAGFPPGVFNVLSGHGLPSGNLLARHMDVRALSFTGSGRTGRLIQEAAAQTNLKKVTLELGGKSPALIFADADMDKAVEETVNSIQWNSGQVCMANSRIYVEHGAAADAFKAAFARRFATIVKPGDPLQTGINHGPQADEVQYKSVMAYIEEGKKGGGALATGGKGTLDTTGGYFVEPTVFIDTPESASIMREEIFGPVVNISTFATEQEAIQVANDTEFGLYAAVYTKDISRAMRVAKALESGYVGVNCTSPSTGHDMPFGGYKGSGQGREGWLHSMDNFLETKSIMIKVDEAKL
ncbi:aldehyde dehydrogenase [Ophiostoma piceae UAMH 11346]|uniref:aldehyde dehydrogenase (NAD(+)) n=1 Tax=Ophiostoma piceae (strain UAMH 11346) TaxID=1262450 RepID=S3BSQ0_OPHP1|nr:aldehyde dehydrogenase [Ophiostoma piceae UAMH 11346]